MSTRAHLPAQSTILVVDDEPVTRRLVSIYVTKAGHRPVVAANAAAARRLIAELGPAAIDCVVTDYNMPGESGLELLLWIKQSDPTLAVLMVTATTERATVTATLRGGATDFLDKPLREEKFTVALHGGIAATHENRRLAESDLAVRKVSLTQHGMFGLGPECAAHLTVCHHPCHAAGGDFVSHVQLTPDRFEIFIADVSGHDLPAAFVSAFFQGMVRGMLEAGEPVARVLTKFNHFLLEEWARRDERAGLIGLHSLCTCVVSVDRGQHGLSLWNHGNPQTWEISSNGRFTPSKSRIETPLGWFSSLNVEPTRVSLPDGGHLFVWTDGLEDLAQMFEVSPGSCATRLLRTQLGELPPLELTRARDDVLVVRICVDSVPTGSAWLPVLHEGYHGGQRSEIDVFQAYWHRSLKLALPDLPDSRLFDLLLAMRETVLNAIIHGCRERPEQNCRVSVVAATDQRVVRIVVSDDGEGHDYDLHAGHEEGSLTDLHRGLGLIHRIATRVVATRQGAELLIDFSY